MKNGQMSGFLFLSEERQRSENYAAPAIWRLLECRVGA
jgi:hypothetical protein